ncbi:protein E17 [Elephant endotheliotropic herpesvirus 1A]|uniref:Protein E17 n=1 Tax=Elephant endotheliotropic herpesvirus 1A TaxID=759753 RepID=A0A0S1NHX3_ELHV1|nr:protein E17 [Elephant endotheliotropic herpesvirus 1A]
MEEFHENASKLFVDPLTPKIFGKLLLGLLLIIPTYCFMLLATFMYGVIWLVSGLVYMVTNREFQCVKVVLRFLFRYGCCKPMDFLKNMLCGCCVWSEEFNFDYYEEQERSRHVFDRLTLKLHTEATVFKHEVVDVSNIEEVGEVEEEHQQNTRVPPPPPQVSFFCDCGNREHVTIENGSTPSAGLIPPDSGDVYICSIQEYSSSSDEERPCSVNDKVFEVASSDEEDGPKPYFREKVPKP